MHPQPSLRSSPRELPPPDRLSTPDVPDRATSATGGVFPESALRCAPPMEAGHTGPIYPAADDSRPVTRPIWSNWLTQRLRGQRVPAPVPVMHPNSPAKEIQPHNSVAATCEALLSVVCSPFGRAKMRFRETKSVSCRPWRGFRIRSRLRKGRQPGCGAIRSTLNWHTRANCRSPAE